MAILPTTGLELDEDFALEQQPSKTWKIDKETNRITGETDGYAATKQAVEIILNVERFLWQIYTPDSGMQWEGLLGQDAGYVASELQRRAREALLMDDRVQGITGFSYSMDGDTLTAEMEVATVYGMVPAKVEGTLT